MILRKIVFDKENSFFPKLGGKNLNFCINEKPATFVILIGKNGCGKTMLLNFLLQVFLLHKYIYPYSRVDNYLTSSDSKKSVVLLFNDSNYEVELNLSNKINNTNYKNCFTFSIDNHGWANDFFIPTYCLTNSSQNSCVRNNNLFIERTRETNEIFFQIDDRIDIAKVVNHYKIPPTWRKQIYEINLKNSWDTLLSLSKKPSETDKILNDDLYEHNEENKQLIKKLIKLKFTKKISDLFNMKHNFKYDENKNLIYEEENSYYSINSLSSGKKKNFSLTLFFEFFFHNLKKFNKNNVFSFLFDEIEKSLCPFEQQKIVEQIINYEDKMKEIKHQFFISTHSPFILKNFLNREDTVIINVENGENIKISKDKGILLNKNNRTSYDEIVYLYYGIVSSSYYLSLYEKLKYEIDESAENDKIKDESKEEKNIRSKIDEWLIKNKDKINNYILQKNKEKNINELGVLLLEKIKVVDLRLLTNNGELKNNNLDDNNWLIQTNLTRLRHILAHGMDNEKNFLFFDKYKNKYFDINDNNDSEEINKRTNDFYDILPSLEKNNNENKNNKIETTLRKHIELIREILFFKNENKT